MIKSITVTNYLGDSIKLELARPELSGFAVLGVTGLGPGKATINNTEISTNHGGLFNSARLPSRNIVIGLKYMWKDSIEDARQLSYRYFPLMKTVKLLFETDNRYAEVEGYVEANEPDIFSKDEMTQISIICPDPFFYTTNGREIIFSGIEPLFEFPFCNNSLTEPLLEMSRLNNFVEKNIIYDGDFDTGVTINITAIGEVKGFAMYNTVTREVMRISTDKLIELTGKGIVAGDKINICTIPGKKAVELLRDGTTINILNCIDRNSNWFKLRKGNNTFAYVAETGVENIQLSVKHNNVYEGL